MIYWMRKKPLRATGKHQKEREGCRGRRSKKKMDVEDGTDNGKESQEEEVRDIKEPTIKRMGTAFMVLTIVSKYLESMRRQEKAQEEC